MWNAQLGREEDAVTRWTLTLDRSYSRSSRSRFTTFHVVVLSVTSSTHDNSRSQLQILMDV